MSTTTWTTILGGAGFLGSHLAELLVGRGERVRIFDRPNADRRNLVAVADRIEFLGGDFLNESDLEHAVDGSSILYHLVSTTIPATSNENPVYDVESNLVPTLNLLDFAARSGVDRVVFVSSGGTVYGRPERLPVPETHPTRPLVSYGVVKRTIEHYLRLYRHHRGLSSCVVRLSNPFGPRQDPRGAQGAASVFLAKAFRGEPISIWGDGSVVRDYIYVTDAVAGLAAAGVYRGSDTVFNIGSGEGVSLSRLVETISRVCGRPLDVRHLPARPFDVPENVLDIGRARRELGWAPGVAMEEGLRRTWAWLEKTGGGSHPPGDAR